MDDRFNTIAGWVLGAGIVLLGATLITGEIFKAERPDPMGYPIEGVETEGEGGEAEQPVAALLQTADASLGEAVFRKCAACHTIEQGGANTLGPNLWGTMGAPLGHVAGFNYSDALKGLGGNWDWERMDDWLASPRTFAPGTKMTFAGLGDPQDRADLMLYMNQQSGNPLPIPPAPATGGEGELSPEQQAAELADEPASGDQAKDVPILDEAEVPDSAIKGPAAPDQ